MVLGPTSSPCYGISQQPYEWSFSLLGVEFPLLFIKVAWSLRLSKTKLILRILVSDKYVVLYIKYTVIMDNWYKSQKSVRICKVGSYHEADIRICFIYFVSFRLISSGQR